MALHHVELRHSVTCVALVGGGMCGLPREPHLHYNLCHKHSQGRLEEYHAYHMFNLDVSDVFTKSFLFLLSPIRCEKTVTYLS